MNNGWIKLHRKIQDCFIWTEKPFDKARAWIDLLLLATHKDKKIIIDGTVVFISRGSFITSILKLAERWGWSRNKTISFIKMLEKEEMITAESTTKGTTITIVNYEEYQSLNELEGTTESTTDSTTESISEGETGSTQNKNIKNIKNDKNEKKYITVSNETVRQTETLRRVISEWNSLQNYGIKAVSRINSGSKRYSSLCARIQEYSVEDVLTAIEKIKNSDFLQGKNKNGWTITFDWFVLPSNFPKVLEGQYDNTSPKNGNTKKLERWNI